MGTLTTASDLAFTTAEARQRPRSDRHIVLVNTRHAWYGAAEDLRAGVDAGCGERAAAW